MITQKPSHILTLSCRDGVGIVAAATDDLAQQGALGTEAHHFREPIRTARFCVSSLSREGQPRWTSIEL
ncbi:MAG: hypothetical protein JWO52_6635 [Gammaproteobacteria bacterium]|jgi:formyltetrahydrofolate hydrolase|nr:hypothetical protein [Gammaproteobacteria bacterium]